jgi:hypothetical protein
VRTYQVTRREGELLGDIDWNYKFSDHIETRGGPPESKAHFLFNQILNLWQAERIHKDGVLLRVREGEYWHDLIAVGMYDGWPYWKPVPAILISGPIGSEWRHFPCVDEYKLP